MNEEELLKKLLDAYHEEALEHIGIMGKGLVELEKESNTERNKNIIEEIYRSAHSMKGASRAVNFLEIEKICQSLESCFSMLKSGTLKASARIFDIFHTIIDALEQIVSGQEKISQETVLYYVSLLENITSYSSAPELEELASKEDKQAYVSFPEVEEKKNVTEISPATSTIDEKTTDTKQPLKSTKDTIRLSTKKIDDIYLLAEESLQIKLSLHEEINSVKAVEEEVKKIMNDWSKLSSTAKKDLLQIDKIGNSAGSKPLSGKNTLELFNSFNDSMKSLDKKITTLKQTSSYVSNTSQNILDNLLVEVKNILMLPFSNLFDGFPKMVREISRDMKKNVALSVKGAEIEADRRIMESLKDPITHILRNSIDHGIELPIDREKAGKDAQGRIDINIHQINANQVQITIADNGSGINKQQVINKAIQQKIIPEEESQDLSDQEINQLILKSGLSTSNLITDLSGRGLGLAIVEEHVEKLGGKVFIESVAGEGCKFIITVPTSIATSQGLLVKINSKKFILPVANIIETLRIRTESTRKVENQDTIQHQGNTMPIIKLGNILGIDHSTDASKIFYHVVVVKSKGHKIGFIVDELENEQEVLFKPLNYPIINLKNVAGVSLLGTGEICPILNNQELIRSALKFKNLTITSAEKGEQKTAQQSILIAEDSITSRIFIKNVLEGAGYKVKAVIDGMEALTALKQSMFDLLVSDVEMPRMNGFELTKAVRDDSKLSELPVILMTSLSKREHQEKGIESGANAYIVKSSFEQSNLLEVIKRLI